MSSAINVGWAFLPNKNLWGLNMIEISNLEEAYETLKSCYQDFTENQESRFIEYITDSCVKRFEYTLETAWKLTKKVLIEKYGKNEKELSMNNIFRFMQGYDYVKNWENWRNYYQKRNDTAHEYNLLKSRKLLEIMPQFLEDVEDLIKGLKKDLNDD